MIEFYQDSAIGTHSGGPSFRRNKQVTQRITPHLTKLQLITQSCHESTPNRESKIAFQNILVYTPKTNAQIHDNLNGKSRERHLALCANFEKTSKNLAPKVELLP